MNRVTIFAALAALLVSGTALSGEYHPPVLNSSVSHIGASFGLGSAATSGGGAGSSVEGIAKGRCGVVSASDTSFSTGASFSSSTIGFGLTGGLTGAVGSDKTKIDRSDLSESAGLTGGLGGALGLTSTSIAGHTDNSGTTGIASSHSYDGQAKFAGGAYSESSAAAGNWVTFDYKLDVTEYKPVKEEYKRHHRGEHDD